MSDSVNHPSHYNNRTIEVIEIIDAFNLDFNIGNAIKYLIRAGVKDPLKYIEDLKKAIWYIEHFQNTYDNIPKLYESYSEFKRCNEKVFDFAIHWVIAQLDSALMSTNIVEAITLLLEGFPGEFSSYSRACKLIEKEISKSESC